MAERSCFTIDAIFLSVIVSRSCLTLLAITYLEYTDCHARRTIILNICDFDLRNTHIAHIYTHTSIGYELLSHVSNVL